MSIPPRFLDELRSRITLSEVIGKKIKLTRAGREFKGCCPFHNEKTASFYVNDDKQFYHCFGCGAHGSVFDFVMNLENYSFIEAIESLAGKVGMQVPQSSPQDIEKAKKEKSLYTLMDDAAKYMEAMLEEPSAKTARDYVLKVRSVPQEIVNSFRIGYAPDDRQAMRKHLTGLGYTDAQMIEAGLIKRSDKSPEPYAFFRERVMFPVPDRRGRIVAFGGRVLPDHLRVPERGDYKPAKYINSSDTPLFHKGGMLYGEPHARQAALDGQSIIVVEGYLDVIACFRAGFRGAVAPLGTALTEDQILVLWKMIPEEPKVPILCFDGDNAGRRAASRACARLLPLLKPNHSAKIAFLPEGQDPDSLVLASGPQALQAVLDKALNLVDFLWMDHTEGKKFATPEERAGLSKNLEDEASRISDRAVQHFYREAFREKIRAAFAPAQHAVKQPWQSRPQVGNRASYSGKGGKWKEDQPVAPILNLRRPIFSRGNFIPVALLACVLNNPGIFQDIEEEFGHLHLTENSLDRLRQAVLSTLGQSPHLDAEGLKTHLIEQGFGGELQQILSDSIYTHASFARPQKESYEALNPWREAFRAMEAHLARADLERAKAALMEELNEDNASRFAALDKRINPDG
jgi:DNA primase